MEKKTEKANPKSIIVTEEEKKGDKTLNQPTPEKSLSAGPDEKLQTTKMPKLSINTSQARGEIKLLKHIIAKNGWKEVNGTKGDVIWSGIPTYEDFTLANEIFINRVPGMRYMAQKKVSGQFLNLFRSYFPTQFDFFPRTFLLPEDHSALEAEFQKDNKKLFIAKPTDGSQGEGIYLMRSMKDLPAVKFGASRGYVVQEYIDKPLIIDNKKFDLRVYVLISSVKPLIAFINKEGLARFCTEDYEAPNSQNIREAYRHLTNYSLNKISDKYVYTEEIQEINDGSKRTFCSLWKSIEKAGYSKDIIWDNIKDLVRKLLIGFTPFIHYEYNASFGGKGTAKCFHLLGVDVLIDENLKPWLLEINNTPSLCIEHDLEVGKVGPVSPVDLYVKTFAVEDSILLSRKKKETQLKLEEYRSYEKVYNGNEAKIAGMQVIEKILDVYAKLCGYKFAERLSSSRFIKLATVPVIRDAQIQKQDLDILFAKMIANTGSKQMDFLSFITAIELLVQKVSNPSATAKSEKWFDLFAAFVDTVQASFK